MPPLTNPSPQITIIMAAHNEEDRIENCINSLQSQTFQQWELIIIDDGSLDSTTNIVSKLGEKDNRIRLFINGKNIGLAASLNKAIRLSNGEFLARADADDWYSEDRLYSQHTFLLRNPDIDIVGTAAWLTNKGQKLRVARLPNSHKEIAALPFQKTMLFHPSVMIRRSFFYRFGYYDETLLRAQDKELWLRALKQGARFANLEKALMHYETNGYQRSWKTIKNRLIASIVIATRHKVKRGYRDTFKSLALSILLKLKLWKPKSMAKHQ